MINKNYYDWLNKHRVINGGLLTQMQASRLLGKTPTRIKQMINEGKLTKISYQEEIPVLSFVEVMRIYYKELEKNQS